MVVSSLRKGIVSERPARTQDVKPLGEKSPADIRTEFAKLLSDTATGEASENPIPPGEGPRYAHPWFGPIDAYQWHCLLGMHQGIHRKQMEAITKVLKATPR